MNTQEKVWKIGVWVGVMLTVFLIVISIKEFKSLRYVGKDTPVMNSISVTGKGEIIAIPDIATVSFSVTETGKTVAEAQDKSATKINSALKAVKDLGVAEKDLKNTSYNINPHYEYVNGTCNDSRCLPGKSVLIGYDVSQSIVLKIRDIKKAGEVLTAIGTLGVQNVSGLSFSIDDVDAVKTKAQALAITNAKAKAQELAKQLGVRIVRIVSFYDAGNEPVPMYGMGSDVMTLKAESARTMVPEVPVGDQKVISNVTITYEIR